MRHLSTLYSKMTDRKKHIETALVLVLALGVVFWITKNPSWLIAGGVLGVIGLFIPVLAKLIHDGWMKLAQVLGFVMSKVLLSLVYFIVVLPMSLFARLFGGKNGVRLKPGAESYYIKREFTYDPKSIENVW